ncbi:class I SAM-dependent methyltransferase [Candidatus Woesearchaeota archaeon]|nr:class I SAM-dependent methyltransferase [Candidatus Woesearchaeota archaeon]
MKHTDQKKNTVARMEARLKVDYPRIAQAFSEYSPEGRVLTIGSGAGDDYFPLLHRFPNNEIRTTFHEPNLGMAIRFVIKYLAAGFKFENLSIHKQPLVNTFVLTDKEKYALCVGTHCFYYIDDWESSVRGLIDSTAPGGVVAITMTSREGDLYKFRERYFPALGLEGPRSAEDLEELLEKMGVDFISEEFESSLIVDDDEEERKVLSFMLRTHYDQLGDIPKKMIESYFLSNGMEDEDKLKFRLKDKIIWIPKPGEFRFKPGERKPIWEQKYLTIGEFHEFFKFHMDKLIKKEWNERMAHSRHPQFLNQAIRVGYELLLIGDCFASDPYFKQISFIDDNRLGAPVRFTGRDGKEYWGPPTASQMKLLEEKMLGGEEAYGIWEQHSSQDSRMGGFVMEWIDDYLDMVVMDINRNSPVKINNHGAIRTLFFDFYRWFGHYKVFSMDGFSIFNEFVKMNPHISTMNERVTPRGLASFILNIADNETPEKLGEAIAEFRKLVPRLAVNPEELIAFTRLLSEPPEKKDARKPIDEIWPWLAARAGQNNPRNPA